MNRGDSKRARYRRNPPRLTVAARNASNIQQCAFRAATNGDDAPTSMLREKYEKYDENING